MINRRNLLLSGTLLILLTIGWSLPLPQNQSAVYASTRHKKTYFQRHPYQKTGLIGGGIGAVAGGVLSGRRHRKGNIIKGAALGGAAGLGYQYLKRKDSLR
ncbi:MAG: hypothetical protein K2X01_00340 [Cyanobacteria bacterium]|nr:hypothetical protein [Cyanobacteriota bacterium]